ncbi:MAG: ABC transporter permease [Planctomycetales bacterium]
MSLIRTIRTVRLALKSLLLHKLRSGLTMLGIVFGVFSVIAMLAIGEGASSQAQKQVLELGATNIIARSVKPPEDTSTTRSDNSFMLDYGLKRSDYALLNEHVIPTVVQSIPIREAVQEARYAGQAINARIVACTPEYKTINNLQMDRGRFISDQDERTVANVCVLAFQVAEELFRHEDPLGKFVRFGSGGRYVYRVIGVMKHRTASAAVGGSLAAQDFGKDIYVPLRTYYEREGDEIFRAVTGSFSAERIELSQITLQVQDRDQVIPTAEYVRETLERTHADRKDFDVVVPLELLRQADQIRRIFNIVLGSIALISLVVGGIGIMNIMLATVTERTREIGIRRALGARRKDIVQQFLTETVVLSGVGGLVGVMLGLLTPVAFGVIQWFIQSFVLETNVAGTDMGRMFFDMRPEIAFWSLPLAFGISVGIGVMFGLYPAWAAAKLDPIEALRHE